MRRIVTAAVAALLLTAACGGAGRGAGDKDEAEEKPVSTPPRIAHEGGRTIVTLDAATREHGGIGVEALRAATQAAELTAHGSVLEITDLVDAQAAAAAAAARAAKAQAALQASRAEQRRIQALHAAERNASDKALEQATAALQSDTADLQAAEAAARALSSAADQRWGPVIAGWLAHGSRPLEALLRQSERLVQLTVAPGPALPAAPATARLETSRASTVEARLVSPAPRTDPRIQGESWFFRAPAGPLLLPGQSVVGHLSVGPPQTGVVVPAPAVVWWQGRAWAYVEEAPGRFARREVPTDAPADGGWFVTAGLSPGDEVVLRGAGLLLSEEGRGAVSGSEG
jgi:hypothetical protein